MCICGYGDSTNTETENKEIETAFQTEEQGSAQPARVVKEKLIGKSFVKPATEMYIRFSEHPSDSEYIEKIRGCETIPVSVRESAVRFVKKNGFVGLLKELSLRRG